MKWQMEFNMKKCEYLHFRKLNQCRNCALNGGVLQSVVEQRPGDRGTWFP